MNTSIHRYLILAVIAVFCCSPALCAPDAAGPTYLARVSVQVVPPAGQKAEAFLRAQLPKNDPSVTLKPVPDTDLFYICVTAPNAKTAADRANQIAVGIQSALGADGNIMRLKIWERAQPQKEPVAPNESKR